MSRSAPRPPFKYWAFISYSHSDARWSDWLHRKLEGYRVPRRLVGRRSERGYTVPRRLFPVFRDREELPTSSDLGASIETALRESRYLIVVCSPRSAASLWVNQEIKTFKSLYGENGVLSLIVEGEPNATDRPSCGMPEAFPEALRYRVNARGELTSQRTEPVAADARPGKDGRENARLKILAGLLGVGFDELKRRERARRTRRRIAWGSAAAALIAVALAGWQWQESRRAEAVRLEQSLADFGEGTDRLGRGDLNLGPLYLARALRSAPTLAGPAFRICDLLRHHRFALPVGRSVSHPEEVLDAELSANGARIATASHDLTARIWDARSGEPVTPPMVHNSTVHAVRFSPDGDTVLTVSGWHFERGAVTVWDAATGVPVAGPMGHDEFIFSAEFSPDGSRIVSASADHTVRIWDVKTGHLLLPPLEHPGYVGCARFDPEGRRVATACNDGIVRIIDASTGTVRVEMEAHSGFVRSVWFNADGSLVVARSDHALHAWNSRTGATVAPPILSVPETLPSAYHVPSGRVILGESETVLLVRDLRTGSPLGPGLTHPKKVELACLSPDGSRVATASGDGQVRVWDVRSGSLVAEPLQPRGEVAVLRWSRDGGSILVASGVRNGEGSARVWRVPAGGSVKTSRSIARAGYLARFSPDGTTIVTAGGSNEEGRVSLWRRDSLSREMGPIFLSGRVQTVEVSPDGRRILVATGYCGRAGAVHVIDRRSGEAVTPPIAHLDGAIDAKFGPDGDTIVSASCGQTVRMWDARSGGRLAGNMQHGDRVNSVEFSPSGALILTASGAPAGGQIFGMLGQGVGGQSQSRIDAAWIWDAATGRLEVGPIVFPNSVRTARFSPDGRLFVAACGSRFRGGGAFAQVMDAGSGEPVSARMPLEGSAEWAEFSPDGERVLTAHSVSSDAGAACLWDARTGEMLARPMGHAGAVYSARFSPDGRWIVTASGDASARIWDGRTGQPVTDRWPHDGPVRWAEFSPDGLEVVTSTDSQSVSLRDVSLPSRSGSYLYLADLMEAVIGSQLTLQDAIVPAGRSLDELLQADPVIADLFPDQFARP